jgi:plastocyanin domain-containing protein
MLRSPMKQSGTPGHAREVRVRVRGGYDPAVVHSEAGVPLRLLFRREEAAACSEQVVFPAFGRSATLPQGEDVAVELVPEVPGEYEFTCGMGMLRGRLLVSPRRARQLGPADVLEPEHEPAPVEWWLYDDRPSPSALRDITARARSAQ